MSRLYKYKDSVIKFLKDRCCLLHDIKNNDSLSKQFLGIDPLLSIILLTVMNNQQKKFSLVSQGYYAASVIQILQLYNLTTDHIVKASILNCANRSLWQNLNLLQNNITNVDKRDNIIHNVMNYYYNNINSIISLSSEEIVLDGKPNNDIKRWYIKDTEKLNIFNNLGKVDKESYNTQIISKVGKIIELTINIGFLLGGGNVKELNTLRKVIINLTYFYTLYIDFLNLNNDLNRPGKFSTNYVINYGIQDSYELFMLNKQKFIEECMLRDTYTSTIKEIVNYMSNAVDQIIDETSPDLRSNTSTMT